MSKDLALAIHDAANTERQQRRLKRTSGHGGVGEGGKRYSIGTINCKKLSA